MTSRRRLYEKAAGAPTNTSFSDLEALLRAFGFVRKRQRGSPVIYCHPSRPGSLVNVQNVGGKAKAYQVRQVLRLLDELGLVEEA